MWLSDKPSAQEKLAENLASLLHCFDREDASIEFFGAFLKIMASEWFGVDQWRIDKMMMLVRRVTRQCFVVLYRRKWDKTLIKQFNEHVEKILMDKSSCAGFLMHFTDIYLDEIAKVTNGKISKSRVTLLIQPFMMCVAINRDGSIVSHTIKNIFDALLYQSDLGREYMEKFDAWKSMGFPGTSIDELECASDVTSTDTSDSDEYPKTTSTTLDPRAGRVDVDVPEIPFDPEDIIKKLTHFKNRTYTTVRSRKTIRKIIDRYSIFASGKFPLGIQKMKINEKTTELPNRDEDNEEWSEFKNNLLDPVRNVKKVNKKKRKRLSSNVEVAAKKIKLSKVEDTKLKKRKLINSWVETDLTPEEMQTSSQEYLKSNRNDGKMNSTAVLFSTNNGFFDSSGRKDNERFNAKSSYSNLFSTNDGCLGSSIRKDNEKSFHAECSYSKEDLSPFSEIKVRTTMTPNSSPSSTPSSSGKKVRIMLQLNRSQDTNEYLRQLKTPRKIPYDSAKKPGKGLLKSNSVPSPINPEYKSQIELDF
ncbi:Ribosomal RNA processing protein 1 like [Pseudolycoriella hygida]|uniref:Ribosomal RNA processing protein 1 like n=1 Tax=Pseudolycoriella hygida TaxID=35572 RepID=A0A9Q0MVN6_9DIPT|nr:Ribosomal RNA processing protein 1 like [Pseudolycoriella hygida]